MNSLKTVGMLAAFLAITWLAADERGNLMPGTRYETPFAWFLILYVVVPTVGWAISQVVKMGATSNQPSPEQPPLKQTKGEPVNWPAVVLMIAGLTVGVAIGLLMGGSTGRGNGTPNAQQQSVVEAIPEIAAFPNFGRMYADEMMKKYSQDPVGFARDKSKYLDCVALLKRKALVPSNAVFPIADFQTLRVSLPEIRSYFVYRHTDGEFRFVEWSISLKDGKSLDDFCVVWVDSKMRFRTP